MHMHMHANIYFIKSFLGRCTKNTRMAHQLRSQLDFCSHPYSACAVCIPTVPGEKSPVLIMRSSTTIAAVMWCPRSARSKAVHPLVSSKWHKIEESLHKTRANRASPRWHAKCNAVRCITRSIIVFGPPCASRSIIMSFGSVA